MWCVGIWSEDLRRFGCSADLSEACDSLQVSNNRWSMTSWVLSQRRKCLERVQDVWNLSRKRRLCRFGILFGAYAQHMWRLLGERRLYRCGDRDGSVNVAAGVGFTCRSDCWQSCMTGGTRGSVSCRRNVASAESVMDVSFLEDRIVQNRMLLGL